MHSSERARKRNWLSHPVLASVLAGGKDEVDHAKFQDHNMKELGGYVLVAIRLLSLLAFLIAGLRATTFTFFAAVSTSFGLVLLTLISSRLVIWYPFFFATCVLAITHTLIVFLSLGYPSEVTKHRSFVALHIGTSSLMACLPFPHRLHERFLMPIQLVAWGVFHWVVEFPSATEKAIEMGFGVVVQVLCVRFHRWFMEREWKLFQSVEVARLEIDRADAMLKTLQTMFDSQYDASAICKDDGAIQSASLQFQSLLACDDDVQEQNLNSFVAEDTDADRLQTYFANVHHYGQNHVQVIALTLRPRTGDSVDVSVSALKLPMRRYDVFARDCASLCLVGFKLTHPEDSTVPHIELAGAEYGHPSPWPCTGVLGSDTVPPSCGGSDVQPQMRRRKAPVSGVTINESVCRSQPSRSDVLTYSISSASAPDEAVLMHDAFTQTANIITSTVSSQTIRMSAVWHCEFDEPCDSDCEMESRVASRQRQTDELQLNTSSPSCTSHRPPLLPNHLQEIIARKMEKRRRHTGFTVDSESTPLVPGFELTSTCTIKNTLVDTCRYWNMPRTPNSCCPWHGSWFVLKNMVRAFCSQTPCNPLYSPNVGWQCEVCTSLNPEEESICVICCQERLVDETGIVDEASANIA